jgi:membrane protease subunit HflK
MSWQNSGGNGGSGGGGPWGGGPGNNNPWGKRPGNNGGNNGGNGGGPRPPDIEELFKRGQDRVRNIVPGGFGSGKAVGLIVLAAIGVWLASGFYRVEPDQQGVVLRFGSYKNTTLPGLNWHWPAPIETVLKPSVTRDNLLNVVSRNGGQNSTDSLMLTGDENIVDIDFNVLWRIKDAVPFLFSARQPEALIRAASESVMREIIGQTAIQQALTEGRGRIETSARDQIQALVDSYGIGVEIRQVQLSRVDPPAPVVDAFNEVQRARANLAVAQRSGGLPQQHPSQCPWRIRKAAAGSSGLP